MVTEESSKEYINKILNKTNNQYSDLYQKYKQKIKDSTLDNGSIKNAFEHAFAVAYITYDRSDVDAYLLGLTKEYFTKDTEIYIHEFNEDGSTKRTHEVCRLGLDSTSKSREYKAKLKTAA